MAVSEKYESRKLHVTKEGTTLTQVFSALISDWENENSDIPVIGDYWETRPDLVVSDIWLTFLDNINCVIEVIYSTKGVEFVEKRADKVSSLTETFDFSLPVESAAKYIDAVSDSPKVWSEIWVADGNDEDETPPLYIHKPKLAGSLKMYISGWNFNDITNALGCVNKYDFIKQYVRQYSRRLRDIPYDITGDDTGHWLFAGFHSERIGYQNYEVTMEFIYNYDKWNAPYGVGANIYREYDFSFLPYPTDTDSSMETPTNS